MFRDELDVIADTWHEIVWDWKQALWPKRDSRYIPVKLKRRIMAGPKCCYLCGGKGTETTGPDGREWHIDHIIPIAKGGQTAYNNLRLACASCNQRKAAK